MRQTAGVVGLLPLLTPFLFFLLQRDNGGGLAEDATRSVGVPHSQYAFDERGKDISGGENTQTQ